MTCQSTPETEELKVASVSSIGFSWVYLASFALVLIGMVVMMIASSMEGQGQTSGGTVILIGPIPIVLGSGPESDWLILLSAIITVVALTAFLLTRRKMGD